MRFWLEMAVEFVCLLVFDCFQFHVDFFHSFFLVRFSFQCGFNAHYYNWLVTFHFDSFAISEIAIDCRDKHSLDRRMNDAKRCISIEIIRVEKFIAIFLLMV